MTNVDVAKSIRLDLVVQNLLPGVSRSFAAKLIDARLVSVNGTSNVKTSNLVKPEDKIVINYDLEKSKKLKLINLPVIYEDNDVIVIDKPVGVLTHSKGALNPEPTVASWLSGHYQGNAGERAGIVHRLDRATSGVMILAKNERAHKWLQKQFSTRKVNKTYQAVIVGELNPNKAVIDLPIERNPKRPQTFRVGPNGKTSETTYELLKSFTGYSLVELKPKTGRTHQLRVHLAHIGHPILGDTLYGGQSAGRLYLHATDLELTLPSKDRSAFKSTLPKQFNEVLKND